MSPKILAISAKSSGETKIDRGHILLDGHTQAVDITEVPLYRDKPGEERYTIGFMQSVQGEETFRQRLDSYLKAQYQVLGSLASGIAMFDVNGYLQFFNKAFAAKITYSFIQSFAYLPLDSNTILERYFGDMHNSFA